MRNGNAITSGCVRAAASSYRTYEEWKHSFDKISTKQWIGSYRTYEEWKPVCGTLPENAVQQFLPYL